MPLLDRQKCDDMCIHLDIILQWTDVWTETIKQYCTLHAMYADA